MDYHERHGHDVASFDDLPSTHRMPTVSAADALDDLNDGNNSPFIPTSLDALDAALKPSPNIDIVTGGVQKGQVTEIWGPPGVGKTAFGIQLAANCLNEGKGVVWVDGFHRVPIERMRSVLGSKVKKDKDGEQEGATVDEHLDALTHYTCPSLPHSIALLCRPTPSCIPQNTSLIVVDSLSALVNHTFPRTPEQNKVLDSKGNKVPSLSARRLQVLQYIIGALQKLAATRDIAIVILTQCATKMMQAERGATLVPAINASVWEQGISTRLVLYRNLAFSDAKVQGLRLVGVQKLNGKASEAPVDTICAFDIEESGLVTVEYDFSEPLPNHLSTPSTKRKLGDTTLEIADSDDEDYGWQDEDDEAVPPPPSQWQGSEDILLEEEEEGYHKTADAGDEDADGAFNTTADESLLASKVFGRDREIQDSQADW
ncbi:P-loop containing nucleoside triphosphate hydrolase protein [Pseudoneurospora amorphoporcata]|uniref:P-loop containing nucleoside triphosphate hydrolase protein n=1 Tax=Pseudoneurospora amorphoporcata TaxID=241081 RepID=A0AAN6SDR5_9PEZI|nr:P-loop containing nucleoside triphosphate hydrolase protein [Pseudoneurospora amorphoporcata]